MVTDEKDKAIAHLRAELDRHKEMLTEVLVMKKKWQKSRAEYGERYTQLHNENQKLRATIKKLTGVPPAIEILHVLPDPVVKPIARRRWKGRESEPNDDDIAA